MQQNEKHLKTQVSGCEIISRIRNSEPLYDDINSIPQSSREGPYWQLKNKIELLNEKLIRLTSHTSMVLDKYSFFRDKITDEIYFGMRANQLMLCDAHSIDINDKRMPYNSNIEYTVFMRNKIKIEYSRYLMSDAQKMDTLLIERELVLKNAR